MVNLVLEKEIDAPLKLVGGKARGLLKLKSLKNKLNDIWFNHKETKVIVPSFFVVPADLDLKVKENYNEILEQASKLETEEYAVRSSSALEDTGEHSFDGIFDTKLNVSRWKLLREIYNVRKSALSEKAKAYAKNVRIELDGKMPVVVQTMVNEASETGIVYSKFPCPKDIVKVIRDDVNERSIVAFLRDYDKNKIPIGDPIIISKHGEYYTKESEDLADIAIEIEHEFSYPIILEFASFTNRNGNKEINLLQARKLTKLSEAEKFQMPELQEKGLIATTYDLNGIGDFTGEAFVAEDSRWGVDLEGIDDFNEKYKDKGYVFVTPYLEFYNSNLDKLSKNKKTVVVHGKLGERHDYEIARKKGLLYLNCKDCLHMGFYIAREDNKEPPIKTGERVRIVSDGEKGFVFNLSRD